VCPLAATSALDEKEKAKWLAGTAPPLRETEH